MASSKSLRAKTMIVASAAAIVIPFAPAPAQAHQFNTASNITINRQNHRFFGKVASSRNICKRHRQVTLFRTRKGVRRVAKRTTTNRFGNWSVWARGKGRFQAVVQSRTQGSYPHSHTCGGDRSATIRKR